MKFHCKCINILHIHLIEPDAYLKIEKVRPKMALESAIFGKKSPYIFSDTDQSNFIICKIGHFKQLFSQQNSKTTYSEPLQPISTVFHFLIKMGAINLNYTFH